MSDTPFLKFWRHANEVMAAKGQPEMLFAEVWRRWEGIPINAETSLSLLTEHGAGWTLPQYIAKGEAND